MTERDEAQRGRLFRLRLERNADARRDALESIREFPGKVTVRVGGRMRGQTIACATRQEAEHLVREHYNAELAKFLKIPAPDAAHV